MGIFDGSTGTKVWAFRTGAVAVLFLAGACTSVETASRETGRVTSITRSHHGDGLSAAALAHNADAILASLDAAGMGIGSHGGVSLISTQAGRAEIALEATPASINHENSFASEDTAKINNVLSSAGDSLVALVPAQNSFANNGGWVQEKGSFRHTYSGMRCPKEVVMILTDSEAAPLTAKLTEIKIYDDTGNDTSCDYANKPQGVYLTLYASNWPNVTVSDHFGASLKLILDRFTIKSETDVVMAALDDGNNGRSTIEGETKAAAYLLEPISEVTFKTALWLNKTGSWHVKVRATFPVAVGDEEPQLSIVELVAAVMHAAGLAEVDNHINTTNAVEVSG